MSNPGGMLKNEYNIYGLVNPPPQPELDHMASPHQDISSGAVRWDNFVDLSSNHYYLLSEFNDLSANFTDLSTNFYDLSANFTDLSTNFYDLSANFTDLSTNFYDLSTNFYDLSTNFYDLSTNFYDLSTNFYDLSTNFYDLSGTVTDLSQGLVDLSSALIDLSNNVFLHNTLIFSSVIEKLPWGKKRIYPLYNQGHITLPQTKTFSKLRLYFRDRSVMNLGPSNSLYDEMPRSLPGYNTTNWVDNSLNPVYTIPPNYTGITSGFLGNWDLSGCGPSGETYQISPNGWQLGFHLKVTEHDGNSSPKWLAEGGIWTTSVQGITLPYNPQGMAFAKGFATVTVPPSDSAPPIGTYGPTQPGNFNVDSADWIPPLWTTYGKFVNQDQYKKIWIDKNIFYIEFAFGKPGLSPTSGFSPFTSTFTAGKVYLAEVYMYNMEQTIWPESSSFNIEALTSLELIV